MDSNSKEFIEKTLLSVIKTSPTVNNKVQIVTFLHYMAENLEHLGKSKSDIEKGIEDMLNDKVGMAMINALGYTFFKWETNVSRRLDRSIIENSKKFDIDTAKAAALSLCALNDAFDRGKGL
jgi:hypothetical protein